MMISLPLRLAVALVLSYAACALEVKLRSKGAKAHARLFQAPAMSSRHHRSSIVHDGTVPLNGDRRKDSVPAGDKRALRFWRTEMQSFSRHQCRGTPVYDGGKLHPNRTCRFDNVCYNLTTDDGTLSYFHDGPPADYSGIGIPTGLDLRPASGPGNGPVPMKLRLIPGQIPHHAVYFHNPLAVLFQPFGAENFGHQLADDMYAVYAMMKIFAITDPFSAQVLTFGSCDSFSDDGMNRSMCKKLMPKMYGALSRFPVLQLRTSDLLSASNPGSDLMCFHTLLASPGANSFRVSAHNPRLPHFYWSFRLQLVKNQLGPSCVDVACDSSTPVPKRILISVKSWKHRAISQYSSGPGLGNVDALRVHLQGRFQEYNVQSADLAKLTFHHQISMLTQTAFLFSHGGGGALGALFLPRLATLAVAGALWWEIEWMKTLWFIVCPLPSKNISLELADKIVLAQYAALGCSQPFENLR